MLSALLPLLAAAITPDRYKAAVAPLTDCASFTRRFAGLPYAAPLLRTLFADGIPEQRAGETPDAFVGRVLDRLYARLGDPSRVYAAVLLGDAARYDTATGMLTVTFPVPYEAVLDVPREEVGKVSELRGLFDFPPGALPPTLRFAMSPAQAERFRAGGGKLQIVALFQDYGTDQATTAARRLDSHLVRLTPKCALVSNAGVALAGWSFDGWDAAATAK